MAILIRPDVLGPRLRAARTMANLTQEEAAEKLKLARTTVLAIESGKRPTRPQELRAFAELYGVRESELLSGAYQPLDLQVKFRSSGEQPSDTKAKALESAKDLAARQLNRLAATALELESLLDQVPVVQGTYPVWHINTDVPIEEQAEDAGLMFRQRLGLGMGPLVDLKPLLEVEFGLRIFERPLPSEISGACSFDKAHGGFVLLNLNHWPERRQQTAAHEAAHGMVKPGEPAVLLNTDQFVEREDRFCDSFARALLMPAAAVRRKAAELKGNRHLTVRHILMLAAYFRVSIEAMGRRMENLSLVPQGTYDSLKQRGLGRKHLDQVMRESELSFGYSGFTPRLLYLASEAYARGLLSEQQIAEKLDLDIVSVRNALENVDIDENELHKGA
jgi:Zn-dependent peptidase ImmA (M78 family)/transcriptional regulator with XRE-family HTH domain